MRHFDIYEQYVEAMRDSRTSLALGTRVIVKTRAGRQAGGVVGLPPTDTEFAGGVWGLYAVRLHDGSIIHAAREALEVV